MPFPTTRVIMSLSALALLSACASKPQISAQQESTQYLSRASRSYTPPGPPSDPWGPYIKEAAAKFDVPDKWIREVMRQESGGKLYGRGGQLITSGAGAMGLMQVMPGTYDELKARYSELGDDPFDPRNNILAGTAYIREMYDIYGSPGFLAAYNAGPGRLDDYMTRNRTLPEETRRYVAAIGPRISGYSPNTPSPGAQYAMNALPLQIPEGPRYPATRAGSSLFAAADVPLSASSVSAPVDTGAREPIRLAPAAALVTRSMVAPMQSLPAPSPMAGPAIQLAQAEPPRLTFQPQEPLPVPAPRPAPLPQLSRPSYTPPAFMRNATRLTQVAQLPEPPRPANTPFATAQFAALQPVAPPRHGGFALVSSANAAPSRAPSAAGAVQGPGGWAVQVGAFANPGLATSAATAARGHAPEVLNTARPMVASVRQQGGTVFRARLTGLSREGAQHACERLARTRTTCIMVSPDAQS